MSPATEPPLPPPPPRPAAARRAGPWAALLVVAAWLAGMLLDYHPMLLSGLARMQSEWNDTRLQNYFLEHTWRWLVRLPSDAAFWNIPAFYPVPNTAAYSDVLLSLAPVYWLCRAAGAAPDTSFQLWLLAMASLDYVAFWLLLRRAVGLGIPAATLGAFLFAFGASRGAQVMHAQLVPWFYAVAALYALWRLFERPADGASRPGWVALLFGSVVAQLWAAFYPAWFLGFALLLAALWALARRDTRRALLAVLRREAWPIALSALASALLVWPIASHYLRAAHDVGLRDFATMVSPMLPRPASWLYMGTESWVYGDVFRRPPFAAIPMQHEHRLGLGVVTPLLALAGLWGARRRAWVRLALLTAATLIALTTLWAPGVSLWSVVYRVVPGAAALRAVSRVGLLLLIPAAFGVALVAERLAARRSRGAMSALAALALVVVAEQGQSQASYDRAAARARPLAVARAVPRGCAAFYYTPVAAPGDERWHDAWWYHGDAMWAAWASGVPTLNGYSGNVPRDWPLFDVVVRTPRDDSLVTANLAAWARRWRLDPATLCRVRLGDPDSALRASGGAM